jgi:hypothetical protein
MAPSFIKVWLNKAHNLLVKKAFVIIKPTKNTMANIKKIKAFLLVFMSLISIEPLVSCSMYKITVEGKTMVGCNEDAWRLTPHIWFEKASATNIYGAAFTGSRWDGSNGYAPQSGMNEEGLSFSRLASYTPENKTFANEKLKSIDNPTLYLKDILHRCKTVQEVSNYISQYNHSYFIEDVFIYIDKSGNYLVVEPFTITLGNNANYVLSNFCPSITSSSNALKLDRYRNGIEFLKTKTDTTLAFCRALSDTMHVCRSKIGDGTLLTSIWDLNNGTVNLFFYHQYDSTIQFNLKEELAKGDHILSVTDLFPYNSEFEKLGDYQIPQNNIAIMLFLIASGLLFFCSSVFFLIVYFKIKRASKYAYILLALFPLGLILFYYMYVLCTNAYIFYFSSPYKHPQNVFVSITSYLPFLILLIIVPLIIINVRVFKENSWNAFSKWLFTLNVFLYSILLLFFAYWGFFDVFN